MFRDLARKKQYGLADLLLPFGLVEDGILLQTDGSLLAGWKYAGPDLAMATDGQMAAVSDRLNQILCLGDSWMVQANAIRFASPSYPGEGAFPDPITLIIDEERRRQCHSIGARFESEYFLTVTYLPPRRSEHAAEEWLHGGKSGDDGAATKALATFQAAIDRFENIFEQIFQGERLRSRTVETPFGPIVYDDLLAYYNRCLTGVRAPFVRPDIPVYLNDVLASADFTGGEEIKVGDKHVAVLAIDGFPKKSIPAILSGLDALDLEYRWSTRAILLGGEKGYKLWKDIFSGHRASERGFFDRLGYTSGDGPVDRYSVRRADEAEQAMEDAKEGSTQAGIYNGSLVLMHEDLRTLKELSRKALKEIQMSGFSARLEATNAVEAMLGTLPGDGYADVRRALMNTLNVADLMPTSSAWCGRETNPSPLFPPNSPPLMIGMTSGGSPFRYHTHVGDVGNEIGVGPMGSGKSAYLALKAAQWFRFPEGRVIALDRGLSLWPLTMAVDGEFYNPGGGANAGFCPLAALDEPGEIAWAAQWIEDICELYGVVLDSRQRIVVSEALALLSKQERHRRTLTHARGVIQDEAIREVLEYFTGDRPYGYLFDAERDSFDGNGRFICIETEHLMTLDEKARVPAMMYLFHRIRKLFDGRPTLLILDEAWAALSHKRFIAEVKSWLLTIRKENVALSLFTQQLSHIAESGIASTILSECPTKVFLANPDAASTGLGEGDQRGSHEFYEGCGLNEKRIDAIRHMTPKRHYLVTSPEGCAQVDWQMGPVALAFCGVNGHKQRDRLRAVMERCKRTGQNWRAEWLRERGVPKWADYLEHVTETKFHAEGWRENNASQEEAQYA